MFDLNKAASSYKMFQDKAGAYLEGLSIVLVNTYQFFYFCFFAFSNRTTQI